VGGYMQRAKKMAARLHGRIKRFEKTIVENDTKAACL
jgi:hypothetical protein